MKIIERFGIKKKKNYRLSLMSIIMSSDIDNFSKFLILYHVYVKK